MTARRPWSRRELMEALDLAEAGRSCAEIAALLGRSPTAVQQRLWRCAGGARRHRPLTAAQAARRLGLHPKARPVIRWLRQGLLRGHQAGRRRSPYWCIEEEELYRFLSDPRSWPLWRPEAVADPDLRRWALELRADPDLLTPDEVAARYGVTGDAVRHWLRSGRLPAVRNGRRWFVRRADLAGFTPPGGSRFGVPHRRYTAREDLRIALLCLRGASWDEIARATGRSPEAVRLRARLLAWRFPWLPGSAGARGRKRPGGGCVRAA